MALSDITYPGAGGGGGGSERRANLIVFVGQFADNTTFSQFIVTYNGVDNHNLSEYLVTGIGYHSSESSPAADTPYVFKCLLPNPEQITGISIQGDSSHSTGWSIFWTLTGTEVVGPNEINIGGGGGFSDVLSGTIPFGDENTPLTIHINPA